MTLRGLVGACAVLIAALAATGCGSGGLTPAGDNIRGKEVVVDFSDTTFIDSTTLGVLVGGVKRLRSNDGQLSLVCSDRNITKIFEITGLDRVFTIYPTRDEAIAKLGTTGSVPPA